MKNALTSPQVLAALITSVVALVIALLPIITREVPPATATPLPTVIPTTEPNIVSSPTEVPTDTVVPTAIIAPTQTLEPSPELEANPSDVPATNPPPANIILLYDDASFTVHNQSSQTIAINGLQFRSSSGRWDADSWGSSLASNFPANNCLRLRDSASSQRQPPAICGSLLGLQLVSGNSLFWLNTTEFDVLLNGNIIHTCEIASEQCPVFVP